MTKPKYVKVELEILKLLCLNVDYKISSETKDMVEELSVDLAKTYKFDTHKFRMDLKKRGFKGAV